MAEGQKKPKNSTQRKILWIEPVRLDVDLYKSSLLGILDHLAKRGHSVSLIAQRSKNLFRTETSVRVFSIPLRIIPAISQGLFAVILFFSLPYYIATIRPDFIIATPNVSILGIIPGLFISKLRKIRIVLDIRTTIVETWGFREFLKKFWFSTSILIAKKLFDGITIITPLMKKEVCNDFDINPDKVGVWTSGVSDALFNPENSAFKKQDLRSNLGLTDKFVVFYHGVFTATRGLTETMAAIGILKDKYPNVVFFLLGTGPIVARLRALIHEEGLQNNVIIHKSVDQSEVPKFIGMSDVCIVPLPNHPYWRHQSPLKLLECLAMEKVVILTDISAHRSIVGEARCGLYIPSINPMEIAQGIERAYISQKDLEEWGKIGRKIIQEKYTWEKVAGDLENYLLSIK